MKKIIAVLVAVLMILSSVSVLAAETLAKPDALYNYETGKLTVSGVADANSTLTVYVVNPSHTKEDIGADNGALQNIRKITADKDGKYSYTFVLANPQEGTYSIYVKAEGKDAADTSVSYAGTTTLESISASIIGEEDATVVKTAITSNEANLQLDKYAPYVEADKEALSVMVAEILKDETVSENNSANITKIIETVRANAVAQLYNQGRKEIVTSGTAILYDADLGLTSLDENSMSLYSAYNNLLSESAKTDVINSLLNKNFKSNEELLEAFAEKVILEGIANPKELGYGHIKSILTSANCAYVNMTYYSVNNAQAMKIAALPEQSSISDLQTQIKAIIDDPANSQISAGGGGGGGAAGGTVVTPSDNSYIGNGSGTITPVVVKGTAYFADLGDYAWADEAIGYLYMEGIISGTGDKTFAPGDNLTREQFAKVLCIVAGIKPQVNDKFDDVESNEWYAPYIGALSDAGLVSGIIEGTFGVGYNITREDLCVMLYRAFADKIPAGEGKTFTDASSVSDYAKDAVNALSGAGIINGFDDGSFRPQANCTRAEMAKIIYEITQIIE